MFSFQKKKALTYLALLCFAGNSITSVAATYQKAAGAEKIQQYIIYPPVQGEALQAIAERFSLPVSKLTALREQFKAYCWSSTAVLVPYSPQCEVRLYNNYVTYQLRPGETLTAVAGKFNRSTRELTALNSQVMPASKLATLKAGDFILLPGPVGSADNDKLNSAQRKEQDKLTSAVAQEVLGAVANGVSIASTSTYAGAQFSGGQTLAGSYSYSHPENVAEKISTFRWYRNNVVIAGATNKTYKLTQDSDVGSTISFGVTPVSAASTDNTGLEAQSIPTKNITSALAPMFLLDKTIRNWRGADAACKAQQPIARLPSVTELQNLYLRSTRATSLPQFGNYDMCSIHGWPLEGRCDGASSSYGNYWSSTWSSSGTHFYVSLATGVDYSSVPDSVRLQVACVR